MGMAASSDFHKRSLNYLTSKINRMGVYTTQPALDSTTVWGSSVRIAGTTSVTISAPASTSNGWVVKVTSAANLAVAATSAGTRTAQHIALFSSGEAKYITVCTTRSIQTSDTVSIPAWYIRVADPTSS